MKKIGFVDFYISEWHANNYPAWIREECEKAGLDYSLDYVWAEEEISPVDGRSTAEWCREFGAEQCATLEELCEKSDVIFILSPTNPEKHLPYAKTVLSYGKPTYIDKTFAPTLDEAKEIFAIAKKYNTPFFSSSALRYEKALDELEDCRHITVFISGRSVEEYIIHDVEMVVKKLGSGANKVMCAKNGEQMFFHLAYPDDRSACLVYASFGLPGSVIMQGSDENGKTVAPKGSIFNGLIADILRFFEEGTMSFDANQTLEAIRVRDAIIASASACGEWINF
ncbi:MAG: Gfo/Idh/MocA family oxidoreductase [Clostridia bacterium]|nr:Gfo/Idh/MocA family oxidoreductase [Clostridia bacterium]